MKQNRKNKRNLTLEVANNFEIQRVNDSNHQLEVAIIYKFT